MTKSPEVRAAAAAARQVARLQRRAAHAPLSEAELLRRWKIGELRQNVQTLFTPDEWRAVAFPTVGDTITIPYGDAAEVGYPMTAKVQIEGVDVCTMPQHPGHTPERMGASGDMLMWPHLPGAAWGGQRHDAGLTWVPGSRSELVAAMVEAMRALVALNRSAA